MRKCPTFVIPSAARDLVFSATYEEEISRLHLEMTVATQSPKVPYRTLPPRATPWTASRAADRPVVRRPGSGRRGRAAAAGRPSVSSRGVVPSVCRASPVRCVGGRFVAWPCRVSRASSCLSSRLASVPALARFALVPPPGECSPWASHPSLENRGRGDFFSLRSSRELCGEHQLRDTSFCFTNLF